MKTAILGMGTALPDHAIGMEEALAFAESWFTGSEDDTRRMRLVYRKSGVARRHSVLLTEPEGVPVRQSFFTPPNGSNSLGPSVRDRMDMYEREASPLALAACREALGHAAVSPGAVTHLVTVSCSGFAAPGVDVALIEGLGLRPGVERVHVGFMGCHGAINGLRVVRGLADSDPSARVLLCAVELCSLHYHYAPDMGQAVANALFADGAAALVAGATDPAEDPAWRLVATGSCLLPDSKEDMSWRIDNHGFVMTLGPRVPEHISRNLRPWMETWLAESGLSPEDIASWAVHPGGPRILESVGHALGLGREQTAVSKDILARHGNMSSPTVLFILRQLRDQDAPLPCVALGFGPGMVAEVALFR
jgi:predicted naringenin-chalcone synthase